MKFGITVVLTALVVLAVFWCVTHSFAPRDRLPVGAFSVAVVDMNRVIRDSHVFKARIAGLEQEFETQQRQLDARKTELDAEIDHYKQEKDGLSEKERAKRQKALQDQVAAYEDEFQRAQEFLKERKLVIETSCREEVMPFIERLAEEERYRVVLEAKPEERTGVLYFDESAVDITSEIARRTLLPVSPF